MDAPTSGDASVMEVERRAATPIAGAIAGILFAVLFGVSATLMTTTMSSLSQDTGAWLETGAGRFKFALELLPFAGLFFLWFIAVARERLGRFEDQFFSTIFLGSGLLFLAMMFAAAASAGALVAAYAHDPTGFAASSGYFYARQVIAQIFGIYALKMAAIFLISQATLWVRTGVMPRWMAVLTYALALVLLFIFTQSPWIILVFPAWVLMVSVYILVMRLGGERPGARDHAPQPHDG
ncbi:MAG: hypothetical protein NTW58_05730 [Actinobacteria bacterium]|nr:hypothetical protein [Actinomycetota bacterium]